MKRIALLLAGLGFCLLSQAEEPVRNFYFSGYKVVLVPSDTFRVEVENPDLGIQDISYGRMVQKYVTDGSGTHDMIHAAVGKLKKAMKQ